MSVIFMCLVLREAIKVITPPGTGATDNCSHLVVLGIKARSEQQMLLTAEPSF